MPLPCPQLPSPPPGMHLGHVRSLGADRGPRFYLTMLEYAQCQWLRAFPARAILCLDRAMGAELGPGDPLLQRHPMPYQALAWILGNHRGEGFLGNPRVHFQHYADRLKGPRGELRRWRAWACWDITSSRRPDLPSDPRHLVREPTRQEIFMNLRDLASTAEAVLWKEIADSQNGRMA